MQNKEEGLRWLNIAKEDLAVAKHLKDTFYPMPLEIICYHCQQAAEKAIKAIIVAYGSQGGMPKKHDITFLMNQMKNMIEIPDEYYDYGDALTQYGVIVRYPHEIFVDEHLMMKAIDHSEKIVEWINSLFEGL